MVKRAAVPADAWLDVRVAGYCAGCDRMVEVTRDGSCPHGHPAAAVAGRIVLVDDEAVPQLPRFNWGAFFLPFIWGPAHDQWIAGLFLPIWLFMDSIISTADKGGVPTTVAAVLVVGLTLGFQAFFAKRANGVAFRRVMGRVSVEEFARRERIWAWACAPAFALLVAWMVYFHIAVAPTLHV